MPESRYEAWRRRFADRKLGIPPDAELSEEQRRAARRARNARWEKMTRVITKEGRDAADRRGVFPQANYLKQIGDEVGPYLIAGVNRATYMIRMKDVTRISVNQDATLRNIHTTSGASIAIIADPALNYHQAYVELSAQTKDQIRQAKGLIEEAITQLYPLPFVPVPLMSTRISQETLVIPSQKAAYLLCEKTFAEIEAETSTWLELDGSKPSSDGTTDVIHIQITGGTKREIDLARIKIERILSKWTCTIWYWIWWTLWRWIW